MFKHLFQFNLQRSKKQAFGFYLAFLGISLLALFIIGPIVEPDNMTEEKLMALVDVMKETKEMPSDLKAYLDHISFYSAVFSVLYMAALALLVAWKKNIFRQPKILAVIIGSVVVAYLTGPIFGLIPVAWMTTQPDESLEHAVGATDDEDGSE